MRPVTNCVAGAYTGVHEIDRLFKNPREVDVIYSKLIQLEVGETTEGRSTSTFGATLRAMSSYLDNEEASHTILVVLGSNQFQQL